MFFSLCKKAITEKFDINEMKEILKNKKESGKISLLKIKLLI
jgi:hypothetical protein